ncbi:MAG: hypothetical protein HUJ98_14305, partial [Bacteroidaceae bacterium]|nr:hypothetical protein [Bacteroidaceae bacterium]
AERQAAEQAEAERKAAEQAEAERKAAEQAEAERMAAEQAALAEAANTAAEQAAQDAAEQIAEKEAEEKAKKEAEEKAKKEAEEKAKKEAEEKAKKEAEEKANIAKDEARGFIGVFQELLNKETATKDDADMIKAAIAEYKALSKGAKALLTAEKEKLIALKEQAKADIAADQDANVKAQSFKDSYADVLKKEKATKEDINRINSAIDAFKNAAPAVQKKLENERVKLDAMKAQAEKNAADAAAAANCIAKIEAIGKVAYNKTSKEAIDAARNSYNALTADQRAMVANYYKLTDSETKYEVEKKTVNAANTASVKKASDTVKANPKTGDSTNVVIYIALLGVGAISAIFAAVLRKVRKN